MIDKILYVLFAMLTPIIGLWLIVGSMWLLCYIDEIMKKKFPRYKKWHDDCANDL